MTLEKRVTAKEEGREERQLFVTHSETFEAKPVAGGGEKRVARNNGFVCIVFLALYFSEKWKIVQK